MAYGLETGNNNNIFIPVCDTFYIRDPNQNLLKNQYCLIDDIYFAIDIDLDMVTPYQHLVKCNGYIDSYHNIMLDKEGWVLKI